jgi:hypothetical protein
MPRRTLTLSLLGLAAGAAFAAPRLLPAASEAVVAEVTSPAPVPEVVSAPIPELRAPTPIPEIQEPVVTVRPTIPEVREPPRPVRTRPTRTIPELDEPRPTVQIQLPPDPTPIPDGCPACGRG